MSEYRNRLLKVDLTTQVITYAEISRAYFNQYVGGSSLAARLFFDAKGYAVPSAKHDPVLPRDVGAIEMITLF
jgi:aldehyde:ferredoxin oxidoreductase